MAKQWDTFHPCGITFDFIAVGLFSDWCELDNVLLIYVKKIITKPNNINKKFPKVFNELFLV